MIYQVQVIHPAASTATKINELQKMYHRRTRTRTDFKSEVNGKDSETRKGNEAIETEKGGETLLNYSPKWYI